MCAGCIGVTLTRIPLTSSTGSSTCTICPAGSECATLSADPVACGADSAAAAGSIACTQCDPGTAVTSADHCMSCIFIRCVIFMIPKFMSITCSNMLTYAFRVSRYHGLVYTCTEQIENLFSGETPNSDQSACILCDPGYHCNDPANPVECTDGYYATGGATSCSHCAPGFECTTMAETPCGTGSSGVSHGTVKNPC